jgi:hypothetical protein
MSAIASLPQKGADISIRRAGPAPLGVMRLIDEESLEHPSPLQPAAAPSAPSPWPLHQPPSTAAARSNALPFRGEASAFEKVFSIRQSTILRVVSPFAAC